MKKLLTGAVAAACLLATSACKKDLDPQIFGTLSTTNFPQSESDFELYTLSVYKPFKSQFGYAEQQGALTVFQNGWFSYEYGDIMQFDMPSDYINVFTEYGGFFTQFSSANFTFLLNQGTGSNHFEKVRTVTQDTQIISDLDKSTINATTKAQLLGEARMARAWNMYFLLQLYGPVPVILDASLIGTDAESNLTRPARADYVKAIVDDLTFAAANLPRDAKDYGRFNKGLALAVLMRTYMNEKDFVNAEKTGRQILTLNYSLVNDYASLFTEATERNSETMWAVSCQPDQDGAENHGNFNAWDFYTYPKDYPGNKIKNSYAGNNGVFTTTWDFYNSFDPADKRRIPLVGSYVNKSGVVRNQSNSVGAVIAKYPDLGSAAVNAYQGNDIPKARLGDMMLQLAEAINQNSGPIAEAVGLVNQVRAAHGGLGPVPATATASKQAFDDWLLNEEGWETYFEGQRKLDLVRHGKWPAALPTGKTKGPYLEPIPQYNITNSKGTLTQTTGY